MIIDFNHSIKDYDEILNFYGIWDYECPNPGCRSKQHPMRRHAKYGRILVLWDPDSGTLKDEQMEVLRLKCCSCGTTHAVLPMDAIPFFSYSIQAFLALAALCMGTGCSVPKTEKKTGVSCQLLYRFVLIFHKFARQLVIFLRMEGMWDGTPQPSDRQIIPLLYEKPPPWPQSSFFHRFRIPLFLHRRDTVSYPLRFGAAISYPVSPT